MKKNGFIDPLNVLGFDDQFDRRAKFLTIKVTIRLHARAFSVEFHNKQASKRRRKADE